MTLSAFDDNEYMAWHKQNAAMHNPEIERGAWLAGRNAAEAQRDELAAQLIDMEEHRDDLAGRLASTEQEHAAVLERERIELIEWAARVNEQFKLRQETAQQLATANKLIEHIAIAVRGNSNDNLTNLDALPDDIEAIWKQWRESME